MRKPEQRMWDQLRPVMQHLNVAYDRIESPTTAPSFPDLCFTYGTKHGFIEMKAGELDTKGRLDLTHFTQGQRSWLRRHGMAGNVWLMIKVEKVGWYAIKGTLAWTLPPKPTLLELDAVRYSFSDEVCRSWLFNLLAKV